MQAATTFQDPPRRGWTLVQPDNYLVELRPPHAFSIRERARISVDAGTIAVAITAVAGAVSAIVTAVSKVTIFFRATRDTTPEDRSKIIQSLGKMYKDMRPELPFAGDKKGDAPAASEESPTGDEPRTGP
ncbi:hypothetical protein ACQPW1_10120 [Nocardia sp. CA-128927]|uniref:hypothetical protein n=1 Tax=Nocardia sp. CA-128927 TaxID=3239975 RepID=UPI003D993E33